MWPSENCPPVAPHEAAALRHIRFRPTRLGLGLAVMVGLLWLVGLNYQANLAYIAAFWLFGFIIAAVMQNLRQLTGLRLEWTMPSEIFAGQPAAFTLNAAGNTRRRHLRLVHNHQENWQQWPLSDGMDSLPQTLTAPMRGYLRLPEIRIATAAPFGICTAEAAWTWHSDKIVFPAPIAHDAPPGFHADESRETQAVFAQSSDDLSHLQAHQDGTSLQHIAWKAYAKTGEMLDKRFESVEQNRGSHIISYRDYPPDSSTDQLAGRLCFRILEAERCGLRYELELPSQTVAPQKGQREMALTALALW
ncbi:hypothetical protein BG910_08030 [Neisseria chenwenguii]|uniref:DUF58 domain-containing protein n=1 Tax=Neisseria chenwenguii TaxID=1853278 RepID=A0A220S2H9_9NEIS|nr:DUF58 domain-containing protein [Neisseria chenwenguii]ASK27691.1 hypothetical protein BG910_08030 [Neisseria chenwenguii]